MLHGGDAPNFHLGRNLLYLTGTFIARTHILHGFAWSVFLELGDGNEIGTRRCYAV
jgi:hypothetical protein